MSALYAAVFGGRIVGLGGGGSENGPARAWEDAVSRHPWTRYTPAYARSTRQIPVDVAMRVANCPDAPFCSEVGL